MTEDNSANLRRPRGLGRDGNAMWAWSVAQLEEQGRLNEADALALEMLARSYSEYRNAIEVYTREGMVIKSARGDVAHPALNVASRARAAVRDWAAQLGLTPVSANKVPKSAAKPKGEIAWIG